jgi:hypothetical protein
MKSSWVDPKQFDVEVAQLRESAKRPGSIGFPLAGVDVVAVTEPKEILANLDESFDLVVADVLFQHHEGPTPQGTEYTGKHQDDVRLILNTIGKAERDHEFAGRSFPVVLYTTLVNRGALNDLAPHLDQIYDAWEKSTAVDTIAWRIHKLAIRLRGQRPGASLARYVQETNSPVQWHPHVISMAKAYMRAGTPAMQVAGVKNPVSDISRMVRISDAGQSLWRAFTTWEPIGMGAGLGERAHVRHTVNVFWLGYCILNSSANERLRGAIADEVKKEMPEVGGIYDTQTLANNAWFLASIFHDVGKACCDLAQLLTDRAELLQSLRPHFSDAVSKCAKEVDKACVETIVEQTLAQPRVASLQAIAKDHEHDHGVVGGALLAAKIFGLDGKVDSEIEGITKVAARAIMLHHLSASKRGEHKIAWGTDPLGCLLAVCDQLQAWDREYEIEVEGKKRTVRVKSAELVDFRVESGPEKPKVTMTVDYQVPEEESENWRRILEMREDLRTVLAENPVVVIENRLTGVRPFALHVSFSFGGSKLPCEINLT